VGNNQTLNDQTQTTGKGQVKKRIRLWRLNGREIEKGEVEEKRYTKGAIVRGKGGRDKTCCRKS